MKIILDRRNCSCWQPACEAHFGWHFLREEVTPIDCTIEIIDDGQTTRTFTIKDRDGIDKQLLVDDHNWSEAYDSWQLAWEAQQSMMDR